MQANKPLASQRRKQGIGSGLSERTTLIARKSLAVTLSVVITLQPLLVKAQEIRADQAASAANQPLIGSAANGVPLVNIVTPNASGLSHNKYGEFNVGTPGVILNNSAKDLARSQLGGLVQGNANLRKSGPASVILNEVTGGNRSVLQGAVEVHGTAANVIIANPNGLTCDGCGFINSPRVTVSSGSPELGADGSLSSLRVLGGDVRIGAGGADLGSVDVFDIISRKIAVEGPTSAGNALNLVAGANSYAYQSDLITPLPSDGDEPAIAIDSSLMGGMYAGSIKIISTDRGAGVNMAGQMAANAGAMTLTADGKLTLGKAQAKGAISALSTNETVRVESTLFSDDAIVLEGLTAVELADNAMVVTQGDASLKAQTVTLGADALVASGTGTTGQQMATGEVRIETTVLDAGKGQIAAGALLSIKAGTIDLSRSQDSAVDTLRSLSAIEIEAARIDAPNGRIRAGSDLSIQGVDLSLSSGTYLAGGGLLVEAASLTSSASLAAMSTARVETHSGELNQAGSVTGNTGTALISAGDLINSGTLSTRNALTLQALYGTLTNNGTINAGSLDIGSANLVNQGVLTAHDHDVALSLSGDLQNTGTISAEEEIRLDVDGNVITSGRIESEGALSLQARNAGAAGALTVEADGVINGGSALTLKAASLTNAGAVGAARGALVAELTGNLTNTGLLYSSTSSTYKLDGDVTNIEGDILAETALVINGLAGTRAGALDNRSGTIEAIAGDMVLDVASLTNRREGLTATVDTTSETTISGATTTTVVTRRETASADGPAAQIRAGGDLSVDTGSLTNSYSQIAANGDIDILATSVLNEGRDLIETIETTAATKHSQRYCANSIFGFCIDHDTRYWTTTESSASSRTYDSVFGTIQAGGTLSADVTGYLTNNAVRAQADQIGLSSGSRALTSANVSSASAVETLANLAALNVSIDALLGRQALFQPATAPNVPFLIETRSDFIDASKFLGSDYFLSLVGGYDPDLPLKRLGDAYVEYRLIRDQIFNQTGSSTLGSGLDPSQLMQALYDGGINAQQSLGLSFGVALSPSQIEALTQDIVWLEKQIVEGQEVLVPRLYVAKTSAANTSIASAQIKAGQADIRTGALVNSGAIASNGDLAIDTSAGLFNNGGSLFAKADIVIDGGAIVSNRSGTISGRDVTIEADEIINDTVAIRDVVANGFVDRAQQQARIEARGDLLLDSAGSIISEGGQFDAGDDLTLDAGGSIELSALALERSRDDKIDGGYDRAYSRTNMLAEIQAGGNARLGAGEDLSLTGVKAETGRNLTLQAEGDVTIASVQNQESRDLKLDINTGGLFGTSTNIARSSASAVTEGSSLQSGGNLSVDAGGNAVISASKLTAGGDSEADIDITAAGNVLIASQMDAQAGTFKQSSRGFLSGRGNSSQFYTENNVASALDASGNLTVNAGNSAAISGSEISAGKAIDIDGADVSIIGAQESQSSSASSHKSGLFVGSGGSFVSLWGATKNATTAASTSNVSSTLQAGTDIALNATDTDVNILGSNLQAGQDIDISAARDVNITPGAEKSTASSSSSSSGFGINFSSGSGGFSIGLGYKKTADDTEQSANTNALSTLAAGRDLTITSGRDINLQAAQASAERDLTLDAVRDVNLLAAMDQSNYASMHEELFAGISLNVSGGIVGAGRDLADAASALGGENGKYAITPAALAAYKAAKLVGSGASLTPSASLTVGFNASKQTQTGSATAPVVTTLRSGGSTAIVADTGDITGHGAQIAAGYDAAGKPLADGNILLSAGDEINLSSAIGGSSGAFDSKSMGASIGVDLGTGGLVANGSYAEGQGANDAAYNLNSHVSGTGTVVLNSSADTNLKGTVVSGETVIANVGGDLNIESRQDTASYRENSIGAQAGLGASGLSGGINLGKIEGDFANVSEQSGIIAGEGGYHIAAGGNVDLKGGVIASTAEKDENALSAESLSWSNLENRSSASASNLGLSASLPGSGSDASSAPLGGLAISPSVGIPAQEGSSGSALATLSQGNLDLANQSQDLAALNTDLSKANTEAEIFDIDRLKARQESAAALSELLNGLTGDISAKLGFAEGSPEKTALHAAVGAIVAKMAGGDVGSGALAGAVSEIANGLVQDLLKTNPDLTDAQKASLTQWAAVTVGAAVGGQLGAATALDNVNHNYLTHEQLDSLAAELKGCASAPDTTACEQRVSQRYEELDFAQERAFEACRTMACAEEHLSQMQFDQKRLYAQILAIQELGADSALAQRLLANQVNERPLTGDGSVLDQRIIDVLAGISYCEANDGSAGCFETGQRVKFFSEAVTLAAYTALGITNLNRGNGSVKAGQGEAVDSRVPTAPNTVLDVPGRVQSRVNLASGSTRFTPLNDAGNPVASGWNHVVSRHFGGTNTQSQFTLSQSEVRGILRSDRVVSAPVTEVKMINGTPTYVRTVDVGQPVGTVRQSQGGGMTSRITVQTDSAGNLITAYPVP
jgi:filamentous hemagglutinin